MNHLIIFIKVFSESDRDVIVELSRNISLGTIGVAFAAGIFYFAGVIRSVHQNCTYMLH